MSSWLRLHDTDREWEKWGNHDPFFAVLSSPKYRKGANVSDFFLTGERHLERILENFERIAIPLDRRGVALDFGCGVGRVLRPLCEHFKNGVGVDVSPAMLSEARRHVTSPNADLRLFDGGDLHACLRGDTFQFIHSHIVFQHIRPRRGRILLRALLRCLESKGKAYIHVPIATSNRFKYIADQIVASHPLLLKLSRSILGKWESRSDPVMQINVYPAEQLFELFTDEGLEVRYVSLLKDLKNKLTHACWYLYRP
jgi:SAM-dependent methyltransferase